jgi:hypothetical protein
MAKAIPSKKYGGREKIGSLTQPQLSLDFRPPAPAQIQKGKKNV